VRELESDLIIDVGSHEGDDTGFYLAKGFRVIAIEADPSLACRVRQRFSTQIKAGKLCVLNAAIANRPGLCSLMEHEVEKQWSTVIEDAIKSKPGKFHRIVVPAITFDEVLKLFGVPYYLKVDIEGAEIEVIRFLKASDPLPRFISFEVSLDAFAILDWLMQLGYGQFKLINQYTVPEMQLPNPPREGLFCGQQFTHTMSGPFGEETPGKWLTSAEILMEVERIRDPDVQEPSHWFDVHARFQSRD
jgi:FkbM family methyltransferase